MAPVDAPAPTTITLPAELSIAHLDSFRENFAATPLLHAKIDIDGSAVERIDTAGVQLLAAVVRAGASLNWRAASPALVHAATILGLASWLGLPERTS